MFSETGDRRMRKKKKKEWGYRRRKERKGRPRARMLRSRGDARGSPGEGREDPRRH